MVDSGFDNLSIQQRLFLPFTVEIVFDEECENLGEWVDAAESVNEVIQMVWSGRADIEDILDAANDTRLLDIDNYIEQAEMCSEQEALNPIYSWHTLTP